MGWIFSWGPGAANWISSAPAAGHHRCSRLSNHSGNWDMRGQKDALGGHAFPWPFLRTDGVAGSWESGVPVISRVGRMQAFLERLICSLLHLRGCDRSYVTSVPLSFHTNSCCLSMMCMSSWSSQEPFILYLKWQESFWYGWESDTQVQRPRAEACTLASSTKLSEPITGLPSVSSLGKISYSPGRPGSHYTAQIGLNSWSSCLYPTAVITGVHYVPSLRLTFECLP